MANAVLQAWTHWDQAHEGRCNNINAQSWASAAFNIILDVIVVGLPMPMLWSMNLNTRKKVLVMLMFGENSNVFVTRLPCANTISLQGVGFFVTFVSILRLRLLVRFGDSQNLTCKHSRSSVTD